MDKEFHSLEEQRTTIGVAKPSIPSSSNILGWTRRVVHLLGRRILLKPTTPKKEHLKTTSWLDGLRGFAALLVYFHHHQLWVHMPGNKSRWFENSYGYEGEYYFAAMHGIRIFFSGGHFAVATFFVISGYVLSTRPMGLIHSGDHERLAQSLSSGLFRRWIRLFLPTLATTLLWLTSWHAFGWWCKPFEPQPTYLAELAKWYQEVKQYIFLYRGPEGFPWLYWNLHTWTIPFEFKGSLGIYTVLLALSMSTRNIRLLLTIGLAFYFLYMVDGWYLAMFLSGMLLCDLDLLAAEEELPMFLSAADPYKKHVFIGLFIISVILGSVPLAQNDHEDFKKSPGWRYLSFLKPDAINDHKWFFLFWAATFLVSAVPRVPWLKSFFNTRFCQYLGRVSYSLYLVHGPMIWSLGNVLYLLVGWSKDEADYPLPNYFGKFPITKAGPMGLEPAFWLPQLVLLPATLWISNFVTVLIDEPSIQSAVWARNKTLRPDSKGPPNEATPIQSLSDHTPK